MLVRSFRPCSAFRGFSFAAALSLSLTGAGLSSSAEACSRLVYLGPEGNIVTARSVDWETDLASDLWIFPRGMARTGETGANTLKWTAKYGSVIASALDITSIDGMNEKGLAANMLWFSDAKFPAFDGKAPALSISIWAQYMLDNFATVAEAVAALEKEPLLVVPAQMPDGSGLAPLHLSLSDATGDSAIIEYIDGKQVIYHGRQYQVMTNEPSLDQQIAINDYWKEVGGGAMLPGTNRPTDRYVRASYYVDAVAQQKDPDRAVAAAFSIIRNVSVPYGLTSNHRFVSSTRWRTVVDHKRKIYFFESALTPNTFWVDLSDVDFSAKTGKAKKLELGPSQEITFEGNAAGAFKEATPFQFRGAN